MREEGQRQRTAVSGFALRARRTSVCGSLAVLTLSGIASVFALLMLAGRAEAAVPVLKISPLKYEEHLELGKLKQGFIDASNPTGSAVHVRYQVQAFRQVLDGKGELEFYDDPRIEAAITPATPEFDLGPREAIRTFFTIDPNKLGTGGAYVAVFLRTVAAGAEVTQIQTSARVGTLLILDVGGDGLRTGEISQVSLPGVIYGHHSLEVGYVYANTGTARKSLAFAPVLDAALGGSHRQTRGPLVFPLHSRSGSVRFDLGNRLGLVKVVIRDTTGGGTKVARWVVLVTGFWAWLVPVLVVGLVALVSWLWRTRRRSWRRARGWRRRF
jgi:hypothetical protein